MDRGTKTCQAAALAACLWGCAQAAEYGADADPTGEPIGGGEGYSRIVAKGDYTASTTDALLAALRKAKAGEIVYVAPSAEVDLTGHVGVTIPDGVTLAGDRGRGDSRGPLLLTRSMPRGSSLLNARSRTRVTGLRIKGADCDFPDIDYDKVERSWTRAVTAWGEDVEVDNCEISNFHHSGVCVQGKNVRVRHCHIHDVHAYPVVTADKCRPPMVIEACRIHWIWHTIAGTGAPGTGYEARYNLCIRETPPKSWGPKHKSHGFDMHAFRPVARARKQRIAGDLTHIHHNTMVGLGPALGVRIRGVPRDLAHVHHNWFGEPDPALALEQVAPPGNVWVHDNVHGPGKTLVPIGKQTTPRIRFLRPGPPDRGPAKVQGRLPVHVEVSAFGPLRLTRVTVRFADQPLYEAQTAPGPGQVAIDTTRVANGVHLLTVEAADDRGGTAQHSVPLDVAN